MDEKKLESIHDSFKKNAQARGGRGGLGKGTNKANRIQIEYVEEATVTPPPSESAADPKHIFVKFVKASNGVGAKPGEGEVKVSKRIKTFDSDDESDSPNPVKPSAANVKFIDISEGDSLMDIDHGVILNGMGSLLKLKFKNSDGTSVKLESATLVSLTSDHNDAQFTAQIYHKDHGLLSGRLKKAKAGASGVRLVVKSQ